ncbi:hypothetical protein E0Z10_g2844 [Xylaria hypoxylon]|uniref:Uncharacterized protein n=1 Tax=Xylaria hypoxylon TaxID=37992 RepID=A0A4Z0Z307_9PEZI|nr:hypothetical protein E0Z10_g2844 [Xylaria hypoxylon]
MAMKKVAILALAGTAFAQMGGMSGDMSGSSTPSSTPSADGSSDVITTATSSSLVEITNPPTTTTDAASGVPTSSNATDVGGSSTSADNYYSETITPIVNSSATAGYSLVTDTAGKSTVIETDSVTITKTGGIGTGGMSTPNANPSGSATGSPVSGNAVVNGVSIGLFFASVGLTALLWG